MLTKSLITIVALTLGASLAQAGSSGMQTDGSKIDISKPKQLLRPMAGCVVAGQPSEFPNDLYIFNKGTTTIKAGTVVKWSVPHINVSGVHKLTVDLSAGEKTWLNNVLPGAEARSLCKASL
jgi:hypothetical protein